MPNVLVYTKKYCSFCQAAKQLLKMKNIEFQEIDLSVLDKNELEELFIKSQMRTVPQIFFGDKLIGGYKDLDDLNRANGLNPIKNCG